MLFFGVAGYAGSLQAGPGSPAAPGVHHSISPRGIQFPAGKNKKKITESSQIRHKRRASAKILKIGNHRWIPEGKSDTIFLYPPHCHDPEYHMYTGEKKNT
jgi:hypothetical protein